MSEQKDQNQSTANENQAAKNTNKDNIQSTSEANTTANKDKNTPAPPESQEDHTDKTEKPIEGSDQKTQEPTQFEDKDLFESSNEAEEDEAEEENLEDEFYGIPTKAYDEMNIEALGEELERLLKAHPVKKIRHHVREIKMEFDSKFGAERDRKKDEFLASGGNIIDFHYSTLGEKNFNKQYFDYKERRDNYYKEVKKNLQENLENRLSIIEELKAITGVGTDMNTNFTAFKKLQEQWRQAGPVPRNEYKDTWNTYHHYVERFYDFLHLDREFREMDYKHNLEQKLKIIGRAEELAQEKDVNRAFRELQNLHRMWKEDLGPVAQEYREDVWERFSVATKKIHENRRAYFSEIDKKREENLNIKKAIIAQLKTLTEPDIKSHRNAQNRIKEFRKLRQSFFDTGKVPKAQNQDIWDTFKVISKDFNHKKNEFYKNRKQEQKENYQKKLDLIKIAEDNKDSDDFETVTPLMKKIQHEWKKIGYVPRSKSDKIWKQFQAACNHYFDRLHASQDQKDQALFDNYKKKEAFITAIKKLALDDGAREENLNAIKAKIEEWKELGEVPHHKRHIEKDFNRVLDGLFKKMDINKKEAELLKYENRLQSLEAADDDKKIQREASFLHKKIDYTTQEIRQLETNLNFFDVADKDNPLMKSTYKKIDRLKQELQTWKGKLKKLKQL